MSFNQKQYISNFNKDKYKSYLFRVKKENMNIINKLESLTNKNEYINSLIEKDVSTLTIKQIKDIVKPILNKYGIFEIYLFGSYARGEANKDSDIDIYCEKGNLNTLFKIGYVFEELKIALNKEVDLVFIGSDFDDDEFEEELKRDYIKI
jgi:predicted nucleotidyltransferase